MLFKKDKKQSNKQTKKKRKKNKKTKQNKISPSRRASISPSYENNKTASAHGISPKFCIVGLLY